MTLQLYVKQTSNFLGGYPLTTFALLSATWEGDSIEIPFGEPPDTTTYKVVGWTDLFGGQACPVNVVRVVTEAGGEGVLIYGGNSGVRILDETAEQTPGIDDHLPAGYGRPFVWVDDENDLPAEVRAALVKLTR